MKLLNTICLSILAAYTAAAPLRGLRRQSGADGLSLTEIDTLTPQFGHSAGVNPTGPGDCDGAVNGANGQPIKVPCDCPPARDQFIQSLATNIAAGHVVNNPSVPFSFPTDNSTASILARFNAASVTLQNLNGSGVGCPESSTTFAAQAAAVQSGAGANNAASSSSTESTAPTSTIATSSLSAASASSASSASSAPSSTSSPSSGAVGLTNAEIDALTPQFGHAADVNPTGTGDCDGAVNGADGQPIKVPCDCPPARDTFIQSLAGNLAAGHVVNNPSVGISFPTDNSTDSILARFNAATVTLQNLNGSGKGCPQSSTTWTAQANAIRNGQSEVASVVAPSTPASTVAAIVSSSTAASVVPSAPASLVASADPAATSASAGGLSLAQIDALTPDLGFTAGVNPTGTGDCDGAVDGTNGQPIKVPCSCPPARDVLVQSLSEDIAAGHAVNNPSVAVSFPTDNSTASQITRIQSTLVALQNLNGEGQGCPAASTTLSSQLKALQG